jgi:hypothetical protein
MTFIEKTYTSISQIIVILYIFLIFGLWKKAPHYLENVFFFTNIFIGLIFIIYFNPFTKTKFKSYHKKMVFWAGIALITNLSIDNIWEKTYNFKKDIEDDSKELGRKAKKRLKSYFDFLINTIQKILITLFGFLQVQSSYLKEQISQKASILYETIFGKPKARETVVRIVRNKGTMY